MENIFSADGRSAASTPFRGHALQPDRTPRLRPSQCRRSSRRTGADRTSIAPTSFPERTIPRRRSCANGYVQYVNPASLTLPATYIGNVSANDTIQPVWQLAQELWPHAGLLRDGSGLQQAVQTPIERVKIEFRSEFYNIFNHTNLYLPGGSGGGTVSGTDNNTSAPDRHRRRHHHRNLRTAHHSVRFEGHLLTRIELRSYRSHKASAGNSRAFFGLPQWHFRTRERRAGIPK